MHAGKKGKALRALQPDATEARAPKYSLFT
jgi:hypothetical protein